MLKENVLKKFSPLIKKVWLSSPTMHGEELKYMQEAYETNWMSTVGENINAVEQLLCEKIGCKYAVALASGTAALHMAVKLAGVQNGDKVFCSDMTFAATVNPVVYEGGVPVFIDAEYATWNIDPAALSKAFELYPGVKVVVLAHLYGSPGKMDELKAVCDKHGAVIIEDAAESLGATYKGVQTGNFGNYNAISFNGNKIITGSSGGMFLTDDATAADKVRKWSTQARENVPWYQHEELGYNYRMSNVIAGVVRGQLPYLEEHISQKKAIYMRYKKGFKNLPVKMNPFDVVNSQPNYWLSCLLIDSEAMCKQVCSEKETFYLSEKGKTCPTEILEALAAMNAEGRPIWKPMHMQPLYRMNAAESLGATYKGVQTGNFGNYNAISFNGNKIITGSSGGMFLTDDATAADKVRKWSTQARENVPWYQHEELGYNYRMSNVIAGVVRGQLPYLEEHISQKKAIYMRYKKGFKNLPVKMNPFDVVNSQPNYWLSCLLIDSEAMCKQVCSEKETFYLSEKGKTCPTEILEALAAMNAEGRPIWKPMHMQPLYRMNAFVTRAGSDRAKATYCINGAEAVPNGNPADVAMDIFERGVCLPSDIKMTTQEQDRIIEIIKSCFE